MIMASVLSCQVKSRSLGVPFSESLYEIVTKEGEFIQSKSDLHSDLLSKTPYLVRFFP